MNCINRLVLLALACGFAGALSAQIAFTKQTSLLQTPPYYSGVAIAVLDMNGDGLDDIARMNQGSVLALELQTSPNQPFTHKAVADLPGGSQWGMCAGDMDNNGYVDVVAGGYQDGIKVVTFSADGSTFTIQNLTSPGVFLQGVNFADINNDSWLDIFACHDDGVAKIFGNNGAGQFVYQPTWIDLTTVPSSDNSGNYGSVWSDVDNDNDLDLYIAKCRQGVNDPTDPRRINQLFLNNGDGTYTQDIGNAAGLRIGAQSWTADFGDIDNDGDFDCLVTNHDVPSMLLENDGAGHFTDIGASAGIASQITGLPLQGIFRDFDNDGYVDILVAGTAHHLLHNNGDKTFTEVPNPFDNNLMESFAVGDLNHDGFQDVYAGYAEVYTDPSNIPDALFMNQGNNNHYFGLSLRGVQSNRNGVGAKVTLYSPLGIQIREVRSGESYGIQNSMLIHFGMGQLTTVDSVEVRWPSGQIDKLYNQTVDQYISLQEGGCTIPEVNIAANGATTICNGQTVTITAPEGFANYLWSNGATTQSIEAGAAGQYSVVVGSAEGCNAGSNAITIIVDPIEIPTIEAAGDTVFCSGGSVTLTASSAASYLWSNGATTQSIVASASGAYSVTTQGLCAAFTSAPQNVNVLFAGTPVTSPDTVLVNESASLTATGDSLVWYDASIGGSVVGTGSTFVTPPLSENTTYWVQNVSTSDMPNQFVGPVEHQGTTLSGNQFNGALVFDCFSPCVLKKVKVYTATAAVRKIDLKDSQGTLLATKTVAIPSGTTILDLDFALPVATDLHLTTDAGINQANLGTVSPQLRRSDQGVAFPYVLPGYISIKTSDIASDRYYYFYNWEIDFPGIECRSNLVAAEAVVTVPSDVEPAPSFAKNLQVSPNPSTGLVFADFEGFTGGKLHFTVRNMQGALLQSSDLNWPAGNSRQAIDLGSLPKGVYTLEWAGDQSTARRKVVVQ